MENYNAKMLEVKNLNELEAIIEKHKNNILDNVDCRLDEFTVKKAIEKVNNTFASEFTDNFINVFITEPKKAFEMLLETPYYKSVTYTENNNHTFSLKTDNKKLFKFADLEKSYQLLKSEETSPKNGAKIPNKGVTIFGALRFYGCMMTFIRNLQKSVFEIDETNGFKLENVVIDNKKAFDEKDGEVFKSNSQNALEKQLNIIAEFYRYDVKMLKKDLPILKLKAQKLRQNKENAQFTVNAIIDDKTVLQFADVVFGVIASRIKGNDVEIITSVPKKAE